MSNIEFAFCDTCDSQTMCYVVEGGLDEHECPACRNAPIVKARFDADQLKIKQLTEYVETLLIAIKRTYEAGYHAIIIAGGSCDTPEYMYNSDPTVREVKQYLESIK